jgi:hypothetical protein
VESRDLRGYEQAIPGASITVVRLVAAPSVIERRLHGRETGDGLRWHLKRALELATLMESRRIGDVVVATDQRAPVDIARDILQRTGWDASTGFG